MPCCCARYAILSAFHTACWNESLQQPCCNELSQHGCCGMVSEKPYENDYYSHHYYSGSNPARTRGSLGCSPKTRRNPRLRDSVAGLKPAETLIVQLNLSYTLVFLTMHFCFHSTYTLWWVLAAIINKCEPRRGFLWDDYRFLLSAIDLFLERFLFLTDAQTR